MAATDIVMIALGEIAPVIRESVRDVLIQKRLVQTNPATGEAFLVCLEPFPLERLLNEIGNNAAQGVVCAGIEP